MSILDWLVLAVILTLVIAYGVYKSRITHNLEGFFLSNRSMPWGLVLLSIMGTQASAITFLSAPGQAYTDGMRFVQYYFGLPLAMIVICIFFVPVFRKLKVYTAYEFLEVRFDNKTRALTSFLFLLQRGLSTGVSIFAPSIILSSLLGWNIYYTNLFMGGLLIIYTLSGGAKAVAYTQQLQLFIILSAMFVAAVIVVQKLPGRVSFTDALYISGKLGKLNVITTGFENGKFIWKDQYNLISGLIGGFFLALSYFGTDQSQVGRYLTARSLTQSRMGLLMNGFVKVPMQFGILLIGALLFTFYIFYDAPIFFNQVQLKKLQQSSYRDSLQIARQHYQAIQNEKKAVAAGISALLHTKADAKKNEAIDKLKYLQLQSDSLRKKVKDWIRSSEIRGDDNDTNYIFLRFVLDHLPEGLVGLLIAVIFLASWGSIAAAINSLASSSVVDFHKRYASQKKSDEKEFRLSRLYTLGWGVFCIIVAMFAYNAGNSLIEAVNVLGSLFYGVILGVFVVALFFRRIQNGHAVFWGALVAELLVLVIFFLSRQEKIQLGFLWLNPIGVAGVILFSSLFQAAFKKTNRQYVA
ncbi:MAG: sodium:solute symporter [Chitinophagaceae bacterium]|nr:sodium:solute symporter [Chitinophagaceae bacterium]